MQPSHHNIEALAYEGKCRPLMYFLRKVPEFREKSGRRHELDAILGLSCAAMLCGARSYTAISEWGSNYGPALVQELGFKKGGTPCAATFFNVFKGLDCAALETALGEWSEEVLASLSGASDKTNLQGLAMDGKTVRGSARQGAVGTHLLSVVSHELGLTVAQHAVDDKSNEIPAATEVIRNLLLEGRVITVDALLTQRALARQIVEKKGTTSCL